LIQANITTRDALDFGSISGESGIWPYFANPAKSGSGQNFSRMLQFEKVLDDITSYVFFLQFVGN